MVASSRPPIETWSRMELEDQFHRLYQQLQTANKKNNELEKKAIQMNSRFRRNLLERKSKEDTVVDRDKYEQAIKDKELLTIKLKSAKHQLLLYTTPSARAGTAAALTGRTTFRAPTSTVRLPSAARKPIISNRNEAAEHRTGGCSDCLNEKAAVIRLNRLIREKASIISDLQYQIETLNQRLSDQRNQEDKPQNGEINDTKNEINEREMQQLREEIVLLRESNERLVSQSLARGLETENSSEQVKSLQRIAQLEERLREAERKEKETRKREGRLKEERDIREEWKQREKALQLKILSLSSSPKIPNTVAPPTNGHIVEKEEVKPDPQPSHKHRKMSRDGRDDDVLQRLYKDVAGRLQSHEPHNFDDIPDNSLQWQELYTEVHDELEKIRAMLLVQHNINRKQTEEISLLQNELERTRILGEEKLKQMLEKLEKKHSRIIILEEQIRRIAYSGQKAVHSIEQKEEEPWAMEMTLKMNDIAFLSKQFTEKIGGSFFLSWEFFDFELATSPLHPLKDQTLSLFCSYNVLVSPLLIHYLQTSGITVELYRPMGASYEQLAVGVITLDKAFRKRPTRKLTGDLKLIGLEGSVVPEGTILATVSYEIDLTKELGRALSSYNKMESAQKLLPLDSVRIEESNYEFLNIVINQVTGLQNLQRGSMEVCVVYELLSFSPFFTDFRLSSSSVEFRSRKEWALPAQNIRNYLQDAELTLYLVENGSKEAVICLLSLPLLPLSNNSSIAGNFSMITAEGEECGVCVDLSLTWKHGAMISSSASTTTSSMATTTSTMTSTTSTMSSTTISKGPPRTTTDTSQRVQSHVPPPLLQTLSEESSSSSRISEESINIDSPISKQGGREPEVLGSSGHEISMSRESSLADRDVTPSPSEVKTMEKEKSPSPQQVTPEIPSLRSSPSSQESVASNQTFTKEQPQVASPVFLSDHDESASSPDLTSTGKLSKDSPQLSPKDDSPTSPAKTTSLPLGPLPPIPVAKPRLSKPPTAYDALTRESELLDRLDEERRDADETRKGDGTVHFSDPLHNSIPPSDTSSMSSPPSTRAAVALPPTGGRSAIRTQPIHPIENETAVGNAVVSIYIDRLWNMQASPLSSRKFEGVKVYVDWVFLDYEADECRVPISVGIPRAGQGEIIFDHKIEYRLSRRRVALLEQGVELNNRIEFSLVTDGEDSEELGVALLDLVRVPTGDTVTVTFLDVNGFRLADMDLILYYSPLIFQNPMD